MGMYDTVNFKIACPNCRHLLTAFQTKDSHCVLDRIELTDEIQFMNEHCPECGAYVYLHRKLDMNYWNVNWSFNKDYTEEVNRVLTNMKIVENKRAK